MVRMTLPFLQQLCKEQNLYHTPELNDKLYLHFKGFQKIENLDAYTDLMALWLEGNCIQIIENLNHLKKMKCLYLQNNFIKEIQGLEDLTELNTLNLSSNQINFISNLDSCINLENLQLAKNRLQSLEGLQHLTLLKNLSVLDLSDNEIEDPNLVTILQQIPQLRVLYLKGNPVIRNIRSYRKLLISSLLQLTYLDDRPVFEDERRCAMAWRVGGIEAEMEERTKIREEKEQKHKNGIKLFREMQEKAKMKRMLQMQDQHINEEEQVIVNEEHAEENRNIEKGIEEDRNSDKESEEEDRSDTESEEEQRELEKEPTEEENGETEEVEKSSEYEPVNQVFVSQPLPLQQETQQTTTMEQEDTPIEWNEEQCTLLLSLVPRYLYNFQRVQHAFAKKSWKCTAEDLRIKYSSLQSTSVTTPFCVNKQWNVLL